MPKFLDELVLTEQASPDTPAPGSLALFKKSDGLYYKRDDGVVVGPLSVSGENITVSNSPPSNPKYNDLWVDITGEDPGGTGGFSQTFEGGF